MTWSRHKTLLAALAALAALLALFAGSGALAVAQGLVEPRPFGRLLPWLGIAGGVCFFASCAVWEEFTRALRGRHYDENGENELSFGEAALLVRWCPALLKPAFVLALVALGVGLWLAGGDWDSSQVLDPRRAAGFACLLACLPLCALPVLASAAVMPGTFADHRDIAHHGDDRT